MSKYPSFSRYESCAASARVRDELSRLRHHMRSEAILGEAIALGANRHARTVAGRTAADLTGRRLMRASPGVRGGPGLPALAGHR